MANSKNIKLQGSGHFGMSKKKKKLELQIQIRLRSDHVDDQSVSTPLLCILVWAADRAGDRGPRGDVHVRHRCLKK